MQRAYLLEVSLLEIQFPICLKTFCRHIWLKTENHILWNLITLLHKYLQESLCLCVCFKAHVLSMQPKTWNCSYLFPFQSPCGKVTQQFFCPVGILLNHYQIRICPGTCWYNHSYACYGMKLFWFTHFDVC